VQASCVGSVKLRKIYELNYKVLLKLSTEHNIKVEHIYYYILKLIGPLCLSTFLNIHFIFILYMNKSFCCIYKHLMISVSNRISVKKMRIITALLE
jgi:hypothetical protein